MTIYLNELVLLYNHLNDEYVSNKVLSSVFNRKIKHVRGGIVAHGIIWMIVRGSIDPWKLMVRIQLSKTCGKLLENDVEKMMLGCGIFSLKLR